MNKGKVLVTGSTGLLGTKIISIVKNCNVITTFHNTKPLYPNSVKLDIRDSNYVLKLFYKLKPTIVIHTASETNVEKCETEREQAWKTNVEGTRNIAEACQKVNAKLLCISTDYVFDGEKGLYNEIDKPNPVNYYGLTKLESEKQVSTYSKNYVILRTSVLYGWHPLKSNYVTWVINKLEQQKGIAIVEDHYNTPTLADNLAKTVIETIEKDLQGVYHAAGTERINRYEFAKKIAKTFGLNSDLIKPVKMSQVTTWTAKRPRDSSLDTRKIQKQLKTKPLNIIEGLNKMKEEAKL